jgi:uncharacterized protein YjiK
MRILLSLITVFLLAACETQSKEKMLALDGFDWSKKKVIELQSELDEISGIAYDTNRNCLLAINDEQGTLFVLNPDDYRIRQRLKFGKKGDYEGVAANGKDIFVLRSDGTIYAMSWDKDNITQAEESFYTGPVTEFESCFWDSKKLLLTIVSKKAEVDKASQANHIYTLNPTTKAYSPDALNKISWASLREKGLDIKGFHPSEVAVQPATGNIYAVSSIEKLLVIFNADWSIIAVHPLDKKLFRQPEGITFDKAGNLLITNEAAGDKATIIFIPVKNK